MKCPDCGKELCCERTKPRISKTSRIRTCKECKARFLTVEKVRGRLKK